MKTSVEKIQEYIEKALASGDKSVYDLLQFVRELRQEELNPINFNPQVELQYFIDDINEFLNTHLDALAIVTTYQKETEYLLGFQQALKMFRNEFEFILNTSKPIDTDETI